MKNYSESSGLVVDDALAGGAVEDLVAFQQLVVFLRGNAHEASLTDALQDIDDGKTVAAFAQVSSISSGR